MKILFYRKSKSSPLGTEEDKDISLFYNNQHVTFRDGKVYTSSNGENEQALEKASVHLTPAYQAITQGDPDDSMCPRDIIDYETCRSDHI